MIEFALIILSVALVAGLMFLLGRLLAACV